MIDRVFCFGICVSILLLTGNAVFSAENAEAPKILSAENLSGEGVWIDPLLKTAKNQNAKVGLKIWFDKQFLGNGDSYLKRAKEFSGTKRTELRKSVVRTLKDLSDTSWNAAQPELEKLQKEKTISDVQRHWIINGFSCVTTISQLEKIQQIKGVKKIFVNRDLRRMPAVPAQKGDSFKPSADKQFDAKRFKHPWYSRYLLADRVWQEFGITGKGTLNIIHDFNFMYSDNVTKNLYRNPGEIPGNGKDDDGNGLVDDYHGYNFDHASNNLRTIRSPRGAQSPQGMHGFMCAAIVCGTGTEKQPYEFGIAPEGKWAGVIATQKLESAVEWAIEQNADTYSMSFSRPRLGEYRSHWRKVMEHGSFCGVYFVSGAGNFAQQVKIPVQMRTPEDIPEVVFAATGVQRNFARTPFASQGPVSWKTEHYNEGEVKKPEVCAFNNKLPALQIEGPPLSSSMSGNSFAGPMFCGSIALLLSADPDLQPWDLKEIITSTATDVAADGFDFETGHGLINCYRAVKETLRRKAVREGKDSSQYEGRTENDSVDIAAIKKKLGSPELFIGMVQRNSQAEKKGIKTGDKIISFNGVEIKNQRALQQAARKAAAAKKETSTLIIQREGKTIEFELKRGPIGILMNQQYEEPVFQ